MSNENYEKVLKQCKEYIKTEFEPCGLKDDVERRIFELVQEWEKRQAEAEKRGEKIGGLGVIFIDVERAFGKQMQIQRGLEHENANILESG